MASSITAQLAYVPPPPPPHSSSTSSLSSAPIFGGHSQTHPSAQLSHSHLPPQHSSSSSSSYHAPTQYTSQHLHHASSLPPPAPLTHQQQYQGYANQYSHHAPPPPQSYPSSSSHHAQQQHLYQERPHDRLPSIRDLDFQVQAQAQGQQNSSNQSQSQQQLQQSAGSAPPPPPGSGSGGAPPVSGGVGGSTNASTMPPTTLVTSPVRGRRNWAPGPGTGSATGRGPAAGTSQHQQYPLHLPQPSQSGSSSFSHSSHSLPHPHSHSQVNHGSGSATGSSSSASSSFAAPPPPPPLGAHISNSAQYQSTASSVPLSRRPRSESTVSVSGGGGRTSVGSIGGGSTAPGASGGPGSKPLHDHDQGGMDMSNVSPVVRSPLVQPPYAHGQGYAPPPQPGVLSMGVPATARGLPSGTSSNAPGAGGQVPPAHSPYETSFPSPRTPHHHLHTPLSTTGAVSGGSGSSVSGGGAYPPREYGEYDYAGYASTAGGGGGGAGYVPGDNAGEHHPYTGKGIAHAQGMYDAPPPPPHSAVHEQSWSAHQHQAHLQNLQQVPDYHHQQVGHFQSQHQQHPSSVQRPSGSVSGPPGGGYTSAPLPPPLPLSTAPHTQSVPTSHPSSHAPPMQGHGQLVSPVPGESEPSPYGRGSYGGGMGIVGSAAGVLASAENVGAGSSGTALGAARAYYLPKIQELCCLLHGFAKQYVNSPTQPSQEEVEGMARNAAEVIRLLTDYRRAAMAEGTTPSGYPLAHAYTHGVSSVGLPSPAPEEHEIVKERSGGMRVAPKRPWEDIAGESDEDGFAPAPAPPVEPVTSISAPQPRFAGAKREGRTGSLTTGPGTGGSVGQADNEKVRTAAEKDMELIRSKRATVNSGTMGGPGIAKGKYRKRSRATPPGKCHSCNIRETPEWRRGPDGARTLCNACGLHYAKLIRKRDKQAASSAESGQPRMEIDMETLRASTRAANEREQIKAERDRERERDRKVGAGLGTEGKMPGQNAVDQHQNGANSQTGLGLEIGVGVNGGDGVNSSPTSINGNGNCNGSGSGNGMVVAPVPVSSESTTRIQDGWQVYTDAQPSVQSPFLSMVPTSAAVRSAPS